MQNAQNQMSSFEFIAALMSIIIGLGVTNLLAGAGRAFYRRKENPLDEVHLVLTVATLLLLILQWWVTFKWNTEVNWTFDKFLVLIAWTIALYLLTVFLYPPDL
jgi:amino acid transporter